MSAWLDRMLSLKNLSAGSAGVEFELARPIPGWAWLMIGACCIAWASMTYIRLLGHKGARTGLAMLRTLLLLLIALLLAGPQLVRQNERVEPDWVVMLLDRSASMGVADVEGPDGSRERRETQLRRALASAMKPLADLAHARRVLVLGFDAGVQELAMGEDGSISLAEPAGVRTSLGPALEQALRRVAGRPLAGVVVLSDGRSVEQPTRAQLRPLQSRQVPVIAVPVGSESAPTDFSISRVEAPGLAYVRDLVPVSVTVDRRGGSAMPARVRLLDRLTGEVLDEQRLPPDATDQHTLTLTAKKDDPGDGDWRVEVLPDLPDLSGENNTGDVRVEIVDRPIRVVYIDGYPRWEYRHLKDILVREPSIRSATMMLAADRRYLQEGTEPLGAIPRSREEWNAIDVIVMGDVRPSLFSEQQLDDLRSMIADRGGGLIWIGGPGYTPGAWRGTPASDLLPFSLAADGGSLTAGGPRPWAGPVVMKAAPAAGRYALLQLGESSADPWPGELSDPSLGWTTLRWAQRIEPSMLKPTTEVLATAHSAGGGNESAPLVMTMRYGAGRVAYVATDETWRYRYGRGQAMMERMWIPLVRLMARESLGRSGKAAVLSASPDQAVSGQQVQITLRLVDQALIEKRPEQVRVRVSRTGSAGRPTEVTLRPSGWGESAPAVFQGAWSASDPGMYEIEPDEALLADIKATVRVSLPEDELRVPQSDHAALAALADATGGIVLPPDRLGELASHLPNRELRLLGQPDVETLWDKPIAWVLLISLLAMEWIGRRLIKLA